MSLEDGADDVAAPWAKIAAGVAAPDAGASAAADGTAGDGELGDLPSDVKAR